MAPRPLLLLAALVVVLAHHAVDSSVPRGKYDSDEPPAPEGCRARVMERDCGGRPRDMFTYLPAFGNCYDLVWRGCPLPHDNVFATRRQCFEKCVQPAYPDNGAVEYSAESSDDGEAYMEYH